MKVLKYEDYTFVVDISWENIGRGRNMLEQARRRLEQTRKQRESEVKSHNSSLSTGSAGSGSGNHVQPQIPSLSRGRYSHAGNPSARHESRPAKVSKARSVLFVVLIDSRML